MSASAAPATVTLANAEATERLGAKLAQALPDAHAPALILALQGDLGAGKTTLARALLRALGVEGPIRSPTYTLVEPYATHQGECLHLDLYRLADPAELDFLGLDELYPPSLLWLVEWPERGAGRLPASDLRLVLRHLGRQREAELFAGSPRGLGWLRRAGITGS